MTTKIVYVAKDGTEFDNAEGCLEYEKNKASVMCWDNRLSPLDETGYDYAMFCASNADKQEYDTLPQTSGAWVWFGDEWVRCEEMVRMCQTVINEIPE